MSKLRLISLVLVLLLTLSLAFGLISCKDRKGDDSDGTTDVPQDQIQNDVENWLSCEHEYDHVCDTDCNKCGEKRRPAPHKYDNGCDTVCNICEYERTTGDHVPEIIPAVPQSCTETGLTEGIKCAECGIVLEAPKVIPPHTYDGACDAECNICEIKRDAIPHTYAGDCDTACDGCGLVRETNVEHTYDNACDGECNVCLETRTPEEHVHVTIPAKEPTCTEKGNAEGEKCEICEMIFVQPEEVPALGHKYVGDCDVDCEACGEVRVPTAEHTYDNEEDDTCNVCGFVRDLGCEHVYDNACDATCNLCGEARVPADHVPQLIPGKDATCTEPGLTAGEKCEVCGIILTEQNVIAGKHTTTYIPAVAATCTDAGVTEGLQCTVCGTYIITPEEVSALGHKWSESYIIEGDQHWLACTRCDEIDADSVGTHVYITVNDKQVCEVCGDGCEHADTTVAVTTEATCYRAGTKTTTCNVCGVAIRTERYFLDHTPNLDAPTCTEDKVCTASGCGVVIEASPGHKPDRDVATCSNAKVCTVCDEELEAKTDHTPNRNSCDLAEWCTVCKEKISEPKAHTYSAKCDTICNECGNTRVGEEEHLLEKITATAPGCITTGLSEGERCSVCGTVTKEQITVPAAGHTYDNACDATCNVSGCTTGNRDVDHEYDDANDSTCNVCGSIRETHDCKYDNECDATCNICGAVRQDAHVYSGACDATCNVPGCTTGDRVVTAPHVYNGCEVEACESCGEARPADQIGHEYDHDCDELCNKCGALRQVTHIYAEGYSQSATSHWKQCTNVLCGSKIQVAAHTYNNACDVDCTECGYVRVAAPHIYDNDCDDQCNTCFETRTIESHKNTVQVYDSAQHWNVCASCGVTVGAKAEHIYNDGVCSCGHREGVCEHVGNFDCSTTCMKCGEIITPVSDHNWVDDNDVAEHFKTCTNCGAKKNVQTHTMVQTPSETDENKHIDTCVVCGYTMEGSEDYHTFIDNICSCGYRADHEHTGGTASCDARAVCDICQCYYGDFGHVIEAIAAIPPTCTDKGYTVGTKCSVCDITIEEPQEIDATGHSMQYVPAKAPTCTEPGYTASETCSNGECGYSVPSSPVDALGHSPVQSGYTAPVCGTMGSIDYKCAVCESELESEPIGALVHTAGEYVQTKAPTCTEAGEQSQFCIHCGIVMEVQPIDAAGHTYPAGGETVVAPTCSADGYTTRQCSVCMYIEKVYSSESRPDHDWSEWNTTAATCTVDGIRTRQCGICQTIETEILNADGQHTWDMWGYSTQGHWQKCSKCGEIGTLAVHIFTSGSECECGYTCTHVAGEASCLEEIKCKVCEQVIEAGVKGEHLPGTPANCTDDQTCLICGDVITPALEHDVVITPAVAPSCEGIGLSEGQHCKRCQTVLVEQVQNGLALGHTWTDGSDSCSVCGTVKPAGAVCEHTFDSCTATTCNKGCGFERVAPGHIEVIVPGQAATCQAPGLTVGKKCVACGITTAEQEEIPQKACETRHVIETVATCQQAGYEYDYCDACETKSNETYPEKKEHTYIDISVAPTCKEEGYTIQTCSVCGASTEPVTVDKVAHTLGDWTITSDPDCVNTGLKNRACAVCGETIETNVEIPKLGHKEVLTITPASCGKDAVHTYICNVCGVMRQEPQEGTALTCQSGGWVIDAEATCYSEGSKYEVCKFCGKQIGESQSIEMTEHNWVATVNSLPTCNTTGSKTFNCTNAGCGAIGDTLDIPKIAHTPGTWEESIPATCTENGLKVLKCSKCPEIIAQEEIVAPGAHTEVSRLDGSNIITECSVCDAFIKSEAVVEETHIHTHGGGYRIATPASCGVAGTKYAVCICGEDMGEPIAITALEHDIYTVITKAATCREPGEGIEKCNNCDYEEPITVDQTEHVSAGKVSGTATCVVEGYEYEICLYCGYEIPNTRQTFPTVEHNYIERVVAPTCESGGYTSRTCAECGDQPEHIDVKTPLEHTSGGFVIDKAPTCTENGTKHEVCGRCGKTIGTVVVIEATGHSPESSVTIVIAATCTEPEYTITICKDCNTTSRETTSEALRHTESDWMTVTEATCNAGGTERKMCLVCGVTIGTQNTDALPHSYIETTTPATCTTDGKTVKTCENCGNTETTVISTPGHTFDGSADSICNVCGFFRDTTAECTHEYSNDCDATCNLCGAVREGVGHVETEIPAVDATCTKTGLTAGIKCENCGAVIKAQQTTAMVPHKYSNNCDTDCDYGCGTTRLVGAHIYTNSCDATCNECGAERAVTHKPLNGCTTTCTVCGETVTPIYPNHNYANACDTRCDECGQTREITHQYGDDKICDICRYELKCSHAYDSCYDTTCNLCGEVREAGEHVYDSCTDTTCNKCSTTREALDHIGGNATCTSRAVCERCGNAYGNTVAHTPGAAATCTTAQSCTVCTRVLNPALGHKYTSVITAPTCTDRGYTTHTCTNGCGDSYMDTYVSAKGHLNDITLTGTPATCTAPGLTEGKKCSACGQTTVAQTALAQLPHSYGSDNICDSCGNVKAECAHAYDNACDATCNLCGDVRLTSHSFGSYESDNNTHWRQCSVCGVKGDYAAHTYDSTCDPDCVCGFTRTPPHRFGVTYTKDETGHYIKCMNCEETKNEGTHTFDKTCGTMTCTTCSYQKTIEHVWDLTYKNDANQHWQICTNSGCTEKRSTGNHVWTNACDSLCDICGYTRTAAAHTPGTKMGYSEEGHWYICTECNSPIEVIPHGWQYTCSTTCNGCAYTRPAVHKFDNDTCDATCNYDCGYTKPYLAHNYGSFWTTDDTNHWHQCATCGQKKDNTTHTYVNSCASNCTVCGEARDAGHVWNTSSWSNSAAGHYRTCKNCNAAGEVIAHEYSHDCDNTCNVCDRTRVTSHKYSTTYRYDGTNHWKVCENEGCDAISGTTAHIFSNTCDKTCSTCEYTREITHSYDGKWTTNAASHWKQCTVCGEQKENDDHDYANDCDNQCSICGLTRVTEHKYDNSCDTTCNICEETRSITHSFYTTYSKDDSKHWQDCSVCGNARQNESAHIYSGNTCTACGHNKSVTHNYASTWSTDGTYHWRACTDSGCDAYTDRAKHDYTNGCDTYCETCQKTREASHTWASTYTKDEGGHYKKCLLCSEVKEVSAHVYDASNACDPNCNVCGYVRTVTHSFDSVCDNECDCGYSRTAPHDYPDVLAKGETTHYYQCTLCGARKSEASHNYSNNCDEYCNTCNYKREPKHQFSSAWKTNSTHHWHVCSVCSTAQSDYAVHEYTNACDSTCNSCGYARTITGHSWGYNSDEDNHWQECKYCFTRQGTTAHIYTTACDSECDTCGNVRAGADHDYDTSTYKTDTENHWYACKNCGTKYLESNHRYDGTCGTSCLDCGRVRTVVHTYDRTKFASDASGHWYACTGCGAKTGTASHAWTTTCDSECDTCGFTRVTTHVYGASYSSDENGHWKQCTRCGTKDASGVVAHEYSNDCKYGGCRLCGYAATVEHVGFSHACDAICEECGQARSITHQWDSTYRYDESSHWQQCTNEQCGAKKGTADHQYASATTTKCSGCNYVRVLGACQHTYDNPCYDTTCNKGCGYVRTSFPADHVFDNNCDTQCNTCKQTVRAAQHNFGLGCSTTCKTCGATRSASHDFSGSYMTSETQHWKACSYGCGTVSGSKVNHAYTTSCDELCDTCGYRRSTTHSVDTSKWYSDGTNHWNQCSGCAQKVNITVHAWLNACDTKCDTCGKTRSITHSYGSDYKTSGTQHWKECTVCGNTKDTASHSLKLASVDADTHAQVCSVCKYKTAASAHQFDASTNLCACGYKYTVIEKYASSVDWINTDGPYAGMGGNTNSTTYVVKGHNVDWDGYLQIKGWCLTQSGINGYFYRINGGSWIEIDATATTTATDAHYSAAAGYGVTNRNGAKSVFTQGLTANLRSYWGQTLDVEFAAKATSGVYVSIVTFEDVTVYNPKGDTSRPVAHASTLVKNYSIDTLKLNGGVWTVNPSMPAGMAKDGYASLHRFMDIKAGEYITLSGWMGLTGGNINTFGYFFAHRSGEVTLSTAFKGTAEDTVRSDQYGGQYASRYVIDVDTSGLTEGAYRIYFVAQAANGGTIFVIQYVDIYVSGMDDDYVAGSDVADANVQVAVKDTNAAFSTQPTSVSGTTYTMYAGLQFTTSASYNSSNYRFTVPSGGITLTFPAGQFEEFNRFKLQYSGSTATKAVMTYIDVSGNTLTDTFYLESGQGTFTCLINGYLDGAMAQEIKNITFYPLGGSSEAFMLAGLTVEDYTVYGDDMTYIQNARFKVGTRLAWGGALCYLEDKNDGNAEIRNLINIYDVGRLVQQSWYGTSVTGNYNGTPWKYNPVQGGDWKNNESRIIDVVVDDFSIYIKAQPLEWGQRGGVATFAPAYMENWYTVYSDRLKVDNRYYDFSGYSNGSVNQEIPAFYFIGYLNSFVYETTTNWSYNPTIVQKDNLPFWAGGSGSDNDYSTNYNAETRFNKSGHQTTWGAWINRSTGFGVGFYVPGIQRLISGRNQHSLWGDTTSPFSPGCSYTATGVDNTLTSFKAYTYSYLMTTGTTSTIRATFKSYYNTVSKDF